MTLRTRTRTSTVSAQPLIQGEPDTSLPVLAPTSGCGDLSLGPVDLALSPCRDLLLGCTSALDEASVEVTSTSWLLVLVLVVLGLVLLLVLGLGM